MFSPIWDCHVGKPPLLSKLAALTWLKRRRTSQGAGIQNQGETLLHKFGVWYFSSSGVWDVYSQVMQSPSLGSGKNELTTLPERSFFLVPGDILLLLGHICCYVVYAEQWGCHSLRGIRCCRGLGCLMICILFYIRPAYSHLVCTSNVTEKIWKVNRFSLGHT